MALWVRRTICAWDRRRNLSRRSLPPAARSHRESGFLHPSRFLGKSWRFFFSLLFSVSAVSDGRQTHSIPFRERRDPSRIASRRKFPGSENQRQFLPRYRQREGHSEDLRICAAPSLSRRLFRPLQLAPCPALTLGISWWWAQRNAALQCFCRTDVLIRSLSVTDRWHRAPALW